MKTTLEWLESEMLEHYSPFDNKLLYEAIHKAIKMEKEQIIEAFADYHGFQFITPDKAIEYYNKTYEQ
jgi:hypothetical protein